jgi:hypothetical protein
MTEMVTLDFQDRPRFYFTTHPRDAVRKCLLRGAYILMVASAHWDAKKQRFKITRPPADHIAGFCIDSGGFTAARKWGKYPWTHQQYVDFIREMSRDIPVVFCANMDYACECSVNRSKYNTNIARINATIQNEITLRELATDLPWLPVLQGDSFEERLEDLALRSSINLLPKEYAGIGSVCGRGIQGAINTLRFYANQLPGVKYHAFGMHIKALDDPVVFSVTRSWDSYSWSWGRGKRNLPSESQKRENETFSDYAHRLASIYWSRTVRPRLAKSQQMTLHEFFNIQEISPPLPTGD